MMKTKYLSALLWVVALYIGACALSGCVTSADLRDISDAVYDLETGKADQEETAERIDEVAERVEERTEAVLKKAGAIPTDPASLIAWLLSIGGTVAGSVVATNRVRDKKRKMRGETVDTPVKPSEAS